MLSTNKLKKIKSNFPVLVGNNVVSKNICNLLIKEISNSKSFDDMIMGGRSRINKGSKNFNLYIKNSVNSAKLFELFKTKKAIDESNKYKVPTGQMDAQSAIGKQWGLPSKESMVMQGLGPNILQGQKYAMPKGTTMPAATHVSGMPLLEEIEGGNQGGIMGLKSHGDITPAFLEPGEFVFTKKATDNIGAKRLYKLMKQAEQMGIG